MNPQKLELVRDLIAQERLQEAEEILGQALVANPTDPQANFHQAEIELLSQREVSATARLTYFKSLPGANVIGQKLTDFLYCRSQLLAKIGISSDPEGEALSAQLRASGNWSPTPGIGIGVTACLIVKNEEKYLERCLASIKGVVDEIVLVDTGSTDRTLAIAEKFGCKIGSCAWSDDFSAARNVSLENATQPWILWIDADEEWLPENATFLREGVTRPYFGGFMVRIVNFLENSGEETEFVHTPIRLFQNHPDIRFEGRIHEQVSPSILRLGLPIAALTQVTLNHYGYLPGPMQDRNKIARTLSMVERELQDDPDNAFHLFNLAMTLSVMQDWPRCEQAAQRAASVLGPNDLVGYNVYHLWALSLLAQRRYEKVPAVADASIEAGYACVLTEYERCQALVALKRWDEAERVGRELITMTWPERLTGDTSVFTVKRFTLLSRILGEQGKQEEAIKVLEPCADHSDARGLRAGALLQMGQFSEAIAELETLFNHPTNGAAAKFFAAKAHFELGDFQQVMALCETRFESGAHDEEGFSLWTMAAERAGDSAQILKAYEAYASKTTLTSEMLTNWGRTFDANDQPDRAVICFTEAHKLNPKDPNPLLNAGDVHYRIGGYLDAAQSYEQALRLDVGNAQAWFVLGNCLFQMGALDGAEQAYHQTLTHDPSHEAAKSNLMLINDVRAGTLVAS